MPGPSELVQIVDFAMAEAVRRSGSWLACRPGCSQCCIGVFAIDQSDAERLRQGLTDLEAHDPVRAARVRERARSAIQKLSPHFPGDAATGVLDETEEGQARFEEFANEEPCPVLDLSTGTCDLYAHRPMTCRIFGPPMRMDVEALAVCELCFVGATDEEIAACEVTVPVPIDSGSPHTIVAFALALH